MVVVGFCPGGVGGESVGLEVARWLDWGAGMFALAGAAHLVDAVVHAGTIWAGNIDRNFSMASKAGVLCGLLFLWGDEFWAGFLGGESRTDLVGMVPSLTASFLLGEEFGEG